MNRQPVSAAAAESVAPHHADACPYTVRRRCRIGRARRRGVASVLAMMFMVIFSSLAAAMAVVAQGNMRTAASGLRLSRAMSAAETGLIYAGQVLSNESAQFVVEKGVIDEGFGHALWNGNTIDSDGPVIILATDDYDGSPPTSLAEAVSFRHAAGTAHNITVEAGDSSLPAIDNYGTVRVKPVKITSDSDGPHFRLTYELVAGEPAIRVTSEGVDGDIRRTLEMDFRIDKKIEFAVISPNRIMIGKNVRVEGPLGSRYGLVTDELDSTNGDPLVMRSDFYWLADGLNAKLDLLYTSLLGVDVDGDGRLRPDHPVEGPIVAANAALVDYDGDEYVDDFDLFLAHFDANSDLMVVYDAAKAAAAGYGAVATEFDGVDDQLARLIDEALADRDGDGVDGTATDIALGYNDGILDSNDLYAKVRGKLSFAITRASWETFHGESYMTVVDGPIRSDLDEAPVTFEVAEDEMREITTAMVGAAQTWFEAQVPVGSANFDSQAVGSPTSVDGYTATYTQHDYNVDPGTSTAQWEEVPFGSAAPYDYYPRDLYENVRFKNVRIPAGCNAVFKNCVFVGVTFVETEEDCGHHDWNYTDARDEVETAPGVYTYDQKFPDLFAEYDNGDEESNTRAVSNNLRFEDCTFLGSIAGDKPEQYTHWLNKVQMTGQTRFYLDPDDPDLLTQPDAAYLQTQLGTITATERTELAKSSILMPGWSFDVGDFNNQQAVNPVDTPKIKLKGTILAGILDVRGTADVFGTLMMTYRPQRAVGALPDENAGPLAYGSLPDAFNTTIGYFAPSDGGYEGKPLDEIQAQGFGEITLRYNPNANLPDGIPWPIQIESRPWTYTE